MSKNDTKKVVGQDDVIRALAIREGGGTWLQVIEATGFNGATLRPHIAKHLRDKVLNRAPVQKGDRTDSPYAIVQPVVLSEDDIVAARKSGMAWYSIANALGISEAKCRALGGEEAAPRVYRAKAVAKPDPEAADQRANEADAEAAHKAAKRSASAKKAAATRAAKKAAKAAAADAA